MAINHSIQNHNWQDVLLIDNEKVNDKLLSASLNLKDIDYLPRAVSTMPLLNIDKLISVHTRALMFTTFFAEIYLSCIRTLFLI